MPNAVLLAVLAATLVLQPPVAQGAPDQYMVLENLDPLVALEALQAMETGLNEPLEPPPVRLDEPRSEVLLVPLEAPPVVVEDDAYGLSQDSDGSPLRRFFADVMNLQDPRDDDVVLLRVGRGLKSVAEDGGDRIEKHADETVRESRVLEEEELEGEDSVEDHRRPRRALQVSVRRVQQDEQQDEQQGQQRADAAPAAPAAGGGTFLETVQNQLPGQLQGLGGAMEDSQMVVGTFQAIIIPGSAATDMGQQIQGFISNMPQLPQMPGGG